MDKTGMMGMSTMKALARARTDVNTKRESSWDRTGGNADSRPIPPGQTLTLAELEGPASITHIWFTIATEDKYYLRSLVLRIWWDGEKQPSVECPVGDFFGMGHARMSPYQCFPFNVTNGGGNEGDFSALNCYFQMPFAKSARITVENQGPLPVTAFYYYIDYEKYDQPLPDDALRFHCQWRRENPTRPSKGSLPARKINYWSLMKEPNLDGRENYVILEAEGRGHFVGCNLSIDNFEMCGENTTWWGEGDDMIYIDGEKMPSMVGTGSEDYFCHAWGMQNKAGLYTGVSMWHHVPYTGYGGKFTCYRFHIEDPVVFRKSIKVTIEHGHANLQEHDYASTAYWYQAEPHKSFPELPARDKRMPRPDVALPAKIRPLPSPKVRPFIRDWMVLGPFDNPKTDTGERHLDKALPPEKDIGRAGAGKLTDVSFQGADGKRVKWTMLDPDAHVEPNGFVNLGKAIGGNWRIAYLRTRIHSKKARKAILWLGSDDGCKVWLNGKVVHNAPKPRAPVADDERIPVQLKAGDNVLVLKVDQLAGQWGVFARLDEHLDPAKPKPKTREKAYADLETHV